MKDVAGSETQEKKLHCVYMYTYDVWTITLVRTRLFSSSLAEVDVGRGDFFFYLTQLFSRWIRQFILI